MALGDSSPSITPPASQGRMAMVVFRHPRSMRSDRLIWIDLEMTGLDPEENVIIEISTIVTDGDLNVIAEGPVIAVQHDKNTLDNMNSWCIETHGNSGLTERCLSSSISLSEAEQQTIAFLEQHVPQGVSPLCGNTIGQDRRFLVKYMPELSAYFHYRSIDVSTIKELCRRWQPTILDGFEKKGAHLALDDSRESIEELRFYRQHVFKI